MGSIKQIWYLWPMGAAKVQASLRGCAVSPEPPLLALTSNESGGTFRQRARSLAPLNGWACAVKICHDGMLENSNSLDAAHVIKHFMKYLMLYLNSSKWLFQNHCISILHFILLSLIIDSFRYGQCKSCTGLFSASQKMSVRI